MSEGCEGLLIWCRGDSTEHCWKGIASEPLGGGKSRHLSKNEIWLRIRIKSLLFKLTPGLDTGKVSGLFNFVVIVLNCFPNGEADFKSDQTLNYLVFCDSVVPADVKMCLAPL